MPGNCFLSPKPVGDNALFFPRSHTASVPEGLVSLGDFLPPVVSVVFQLPGMDEQAGHPEKWDKTEFADKTSCSESFAGLCTKNGKLARWRPAILPH